MAIDSKMHRLIYNTNNLEEKLETANMGQRIWL